MSTASFEVEGDFGEGVTRGKMQIDREAKTVTIRPLRKRQVYTKTLTEVANWICGTGEEESLVVGLDPAVGTDKSVTAIVKKWTPPVERPLVGVKKFVLPPRK